jgi:putative PIN family toxin of toxin-antitoxin system
VARERNTLVLCGATFNEIEEVLRRPKFARAITEDRRIEILGLLPAAAIWVEPEIRIEDCRDAKDNKYLELGVAAGGDVIVSSDEDLLVLHPWRAVRILRPRDFLGIA